MAQQLRILQSLWAMERRRAEEPEWPLQTQLAMIRDAGFDGAGVRFLDPVFAAEVTQFLREHGMIWQAQCYPTNVDDLKPVLELIARLGADHVNLQPNVRPHRIEECIPLLEGWRRLADESGVAVHVETHRDRMTTDLFFTLQLLDCFPDLRLGYPWTDRQPRAGADLARLSAASGLGRTVHGLVGIRHSIMEKARRARRRADVPVRTRSAALRHHRT
jgi:hypothetical protein